MSLLDNISELAEKANFKEVAEHWLKWSEVMYLRANGWEMVEGDWDSFWWKAPSDYPYRRKDPYHHGHAVNAQKLRDGKRKSRSPRFNESR